MYGVISKCMKHNSSIDCKLDMFDHVIKPILLYGFEALCYYNSKLVQKLHLNFCKLNLKSSALNSMVYEEVWKVSLQNVKVRIICNGGGGGINFRNCKLSVHFTCLRNLKKIMMHICSEYLNASVWQENSDNNVINSDKYNMVKKIGILHTD